MKKLKQYFLAGLLFVIPVFLTVYVVVNLAQFILSVLDLRQIVDHFINRYFFHMPYLKPFMAYLVYKSAVTGVLLTIILIGFFIIFIIKSNKFKFIKKIPILNYIFKTIIQVKENVSFEDINEGQVVLVEYMNNKVYSIGFVTNENAIFKEHLKNKKFMTVFIPNVPNPATGNLVIVEEKKLVYTDLKIKEAMKIIMSGGLLEEHTIRKVKKIGEINEYSKKN